jgi:hypothetical protein
MESENRINVTGMQGNRLVIRAALPDIANDLPHNWTVEQVARAIELLKTGRSNKAKRAACELLETLLRRNDAMTQATKQRITVQVLNGATGECREVVANVEADTEQSAVDKLFARARRDDYYYRFLGMRSVISPTVQGAVSLVHETQTYWALED